MLAVQPLSIAIERQAMRAPKRLGLAGESGAEALSHSAPPGARRLELGGLGATGPNLNQYAHGDQQRSPICHVQLGVKRKPPASTSVLTEAGLLSSNPAAEHALSRTSANASTAIKEAVAARNELIVTTSAELQGG